MNATAKKLTDGSIATPQNSVMLRFDDLGLAFSKAEILNFRNAKIDMYHDSAGQKEWFITLFFFNHPDNSGSDWHYVRSLPIKGGLFRARNAFRRVMHAFALFRFNNR